MHFSVTVHLTAKSQAPAREIIKNMKIADTVQNCNALGLFAVWILLHFHQIHMVDSLSGLRFPQHTTSTYLDYAKQVCDKIPELQQLLEISVLQQPIIKACPAQMCSYNFFMR